MVPEYRRQLPARIEVVLFVILSLALVTCLCIPVMVDMIVVFYMTDLDEMKRKASFYAWMFFLIGCGSFLAMSMQQVGQTLAVQATSVLSLSSERLPAILRHNGCCLLTVCSPCALGSAWCLMPEFTNALLRANIKLAQALQPCLACMPASHGSHLIPHFCAAAQGFLGLAAARLAHRVRIKLLGAILNQDVSHSLLCALLLEMYGCWLRPEHLHVHEH
jgi:hypothetical protein